MEAGSELRWRHNPYFLLNPKIKAMSGYPNIAFSCLFPTRSVTGCNQARLCYLTFQREICILLSCKPGLPKPVGYGSPRVWLMHANGDG